VVVVVESVVLFFGREDHTTPISDLTRLSQHIHFMHLLAAAWFTQGYIIVPRKDLEVGQLDLENI